MGTVVGVAHLAPLEHSSQHIGSTPELDVCALASPRTAQRLIMPLQKQEPTAFCVAPVQCRQQFDQRATCLQAVHPPRSAVSTSGSDVRARFKAQRAQRGVGLHAQRHQGCVCKGGWVGWVGRA